MGPHLAKSTAFLPAVGTSGGILLAICDNHFELHPPRLTDHTLTCTISSRSENISWDLTGVYGPQADTDKIDFLADLEGLQNLTLNSWLILGDFNLIRRANEKNQGPMNKNMIQRFNHTINHLQFLELELQGRRFTWSNEQIQPTMTRISCRYSSGEHSGFVIGPNCSEMKFRFSG